VCWAFAFHLLTPEQDRRIFGFKFFVPASFLVIDPNEKLLQGPCKLPKKHPEKRLKMNELKLRIHFCLEEVKSS
jgi:hypothetical protein